MPSPSLPATAPRVNARTGLPPADLLVPRLEAALAAAGFVPLADLPALYDEILATLDPPVPDALYPHAAARLHTLLCTACPRAVWLPAGSRRHPGWERGFAWGPQLHGTPPDPDAADAGDDA